MNTEDIQKTIEGMLAVQRELQESQLRLQESQLKLHETQLRQNKALEQLLNLHIAHETTHLDFEERLLQLSKKIEKLENR